MNELRKNYRHQKQAKTKIPKSEARDYFDIMENNKPFLYCCNREEKIMYDGESIKYNEYPFEPCKKIFYEKCFFIKIGTP